MRERQTESQTDRRVDRDRNKLRGRNTYKEVERKRPAMGMGRKVRVRCHHLTLSHCISIVIKNLGP